MKSEKEILDALHILQDVCNENKGYCSKCVLRNSENECGLMENNFGDVRVNLMNLEIKDDECPRLILN